LKNAKDALEKAKGISAEENLFFLYTEASIYESACRDDLSIKEYNNCKNICEKLAYNHPDRA